MEYNAFSVGRVAAPPAIQELAPGEPTYDVSPRCAGSDVSGWEFDPDPSDRLFDVAVNDWTGIGKGLDLADCAFTECGH